MLKSKSLAKRIFLIISILIISFAALPLLLTSVLKHIHPIITERADLFRSAAFLTTKLASLSGVMGICIGVIVGTFGLNGKNLFIKSIANAYVWIICGTPLLIQVLFFYYALPAIIPTFELNEFYAGACALAINMGAYNATVVKSGLDAIPKAQMEGGLSLGLSHLQTLRWIIFPQAIQIALSPLLNNWIALLKDTSLVSAIGVVELTLAATRTNSETFQPVPTLITVAILYLGMSSVLNLSVLILRTNKNKAKIILN